jgi:hypothetical protein
MQQGLEYLRRVEVPAYIKARFGIDITYKSFGTMAARGGGPAYRVVLQQAYYSKADLDAWALEKLNGPAFKTGAERREHRRKMRQAA